MQMVKRNFEWVAERVQVGTEPVALLSVLRLGLDLLSLPFWSVISIYAYKATCDRGYLVQTDPAPVSHQLSPDIPQLASWNQWPHMASPKTQNNLLKWEIYKYHLWTPQPMIAPCLFAKACFWVAQYIGLWEIRQYRAARFWGRNVNCHHDHNSQMFCNICIHSWKLCRPVDYVKLTITYSLLCNCILKINICLLG